MVYVQVLKVFLDLPVAPWIVREREREREIERGGWDLEYDEKYTLTTTLTNKL